ncbi:glycoside hydrolase family 16 protein [Streptomyces hygroscopicus]|uniref:glycoside hydrolase family 16 protein n=1 Tax=Streptomyces hygroscopicus TaxID=1912 RepID=UPI0033C8DEF3
MFRFTSARTTADTSRRHRRRRVAFLATLSLPLTGLLALTVSAATATTATAGEPAAAAEWTTVFRDDFDGAAGTGLNKDDWLYDIGTGYPGGAANWGTGEIESVTDSTDNVYQDGEGHMVIKPIRDASGKWTSGRVETQRTDFEAPAGGQLEISASLKQPNPEKALGIWPAFWAMGADARPTGATNWPGIGELDIMEDVNGLSKHSHTFHCGEWAGECNDPDGISSDLLPCDTCQTEYHTYSVIVDRTDTAAEKLRFYRDGNETFTVNQDQVSAETWKKAVDHGFFAIFNVAVGGSYPNKVCGCTSPAQDTTSGEGMSVDWFSVRVSH